MVDELPNLRVLYMSGYADDTSLNQAALDPRFGFIQKPFNAATLAARVRELLGAPGDT